MMERTSLDAYFNIVKPNLGKSEKPIFDALRFLKNAKTNLEIQDYTGFPINVISGRINGLVKKGYVVKAGTKRCSISGNKANTWRTVV